jgi:hypothetical protein
MVIEPMQFPERVPELTPEEFERWAKFGECLWHDLQGEPAELMAFARLQAPYGRFVRLEISAEPGREFYELNGCKTVIPDKVIARAYLADPPCSQDHPFIAPGVRALCEHLPALAERRIG